MTSADLFGAPLLPGLSSVPDVVSVEEEQALIARIAAADLTPFRFQRWTGRRLTRSFGWHYDFQTGALARAEPLPDWLRPIRDRAAAASGIAPSELAQALLIHYGEGAGIGWHRDRPIYDHVLGLSLGAAAAMRFRRRVAERWCRATAPLAPRALYHLAGEARRDWEHAIAPLPAPRWSITFRTFAESGRRAARHAGGVAPAG